jgi:hypothetical protein
MAEWMRKKRQWSERVACGGQESAEMAKASSFRRDLPETSAARRAAIPGGSGGHRQMACEVPSLHRSIAYEQGQHGLASQDGVPGAASGTAISSGSGGDLSCGGVSRPARVAARSSAQSLKSRARPDLRCTPSAGAHHSYLTLNSASVSNRPDFNHFRWEPPGRSRSHFRDTRKYQ